MRRAWRAILLWGPLLLGCTASLGSEVLRIGFAEDEIPQEAQPFVKKTFDSLGRLLAPDYRLEIHSYASSDLLGAVSRNQVELFLSSSTLYRQSSLSGTRDVAVLMPSGSVNPNRLEGSVFLTPLGTGTSDELLSKKGLRFLTSGKLSGTALMSANLELQRMRQKEKLSEATAHEASPAKALRRLQAGEADVLVLPACALERASERGEFDARDLVVLRPKQDQNLSCLHSTELFPGLTLATMPTLDYQAYNRILSALLSLKSEGSKRLWVIGANFSAVDSALHELDSDPWASYRKPTVKSLIAHYWPWLAGVLGFAFFLLCNMVLLGRLVKQRTRQLEDALQEQKALRGEVDKIRNRLDKMKRLQTIGQMASLFAHELRQPLNALNCYAYGIEKAIRRKIQQPDRDIEEGIAAVNTQIQRASAIVEKVRNYVRSQSSREDAHSFADILERSAANFKTTSAGSIPIRLLFENRDQTVIRCDPMEMELVVINLLRNSAQAQAGAGNPWIELRLQGGKTVILTVTDGGRALSDEEFRAIAALGESTKPEGLGLGLPIVCSLVEEHRGKVFFERTKSRSLEVRIELPPAYTGA